MEKLFSDNFECAFPSLLSSIYDFQVELTKNSIKLDQILARIFDFDSEERFFMWPFCYSQKWNEHGIPKISQDKRNKQKLHSDLKNAAI